MSPRDAAEAERLLRYAPRTAGRLMSEKFPTIRAEWTAAETLEHLKKIDPEVETVQSLYVVDEHDHLVGYVSAAPALLPLPPTRKIADVMERSVKTVHTDTTQEEVARLVSKYDVHAIPVVDEQNRPLGIVTVDDVIDVLIEEQTEDMLHLAGAPVTDETVGQLLREQAVAQRARAVQLAPAPLRHGDADGNVLRHFESELAKVVALAFFIPLLIGTGGNSGSQTVTTIVRGLAVGEIRLRDFWRVVLREAGSGLALGVLLGIVGFGRALLWTPNMPLAITVGVSILVIITWANTVGATIPMLATAAEDRPHHHVGAPDRDARRRDGALHLLHDREEVPAWAV